MLSIKESLKLLGEASKILSKEEDITLEDYKIFRAIGKKINKDHEFEYSWLCEGMEIRMPEIYKSTELSHDNIDGEKI